MEGIESIIRSVERAHYSVVIICEQLQQDNDGGRLESTR